jgi:hypothetical protein
VPVNRSEHERWSGRLSELVDGELDGEDRRAAQAHLAHCPTCRTVAADLHRIAGAARDLGDIPPGRDLWPGIEGRLGGAGAAEGRRADPVGRRAARRSGLVLSVPQLAAAAVLLVALSSLVTTAVTQGPSGRSAQVGSPQPRAVEIAGGRPGAAPPALADEVEALTRAVREGGTRVDPETRRILEDNLAVIEGAIDDARRALVQDPANPFLEEHLERAWQRKLAYLREAAGIVEWAAS